MADFNTRSMPQQETTPGLVALPTVLTSLTTKDTLVKQLVVSNPTAGAITVTVQDAAGNSLLGAVSLATHTQQTFEFGDDGVWCLGGVKWQAGGAGLVGELFGWVRK